MSYDTVVVGAGLAGLTAALRLTERGQRVLVVARGVGATHLAPATVDVLGYLGDTRVASPAASVPALVSSAPNHPYGHLPAEQLATSLAWFCTKTAALGYAGSLDENLLLPTALGVPKPSALAPRSMVGRRSSRRWSLCVRRSQGFQGLPSHADRRQPRSARLSAFRSRPARSRSTPPSSRLGDLSGRVIAGRFDTEHLADWLVGALEHRVDPTSESASPRCSGLRSGDAPGRSSRNACSARCSKSRRCHRRYPAYDSSRRSRGALRAGGARIVLGVRPSARVPTPEGSRLLKSPTPPGLRRTRSRSVVLAIGWIREWWSRARFVRRDARDGIRPAAHRSSGGGSGPFRPQVLR